MNYYAVYYKHLLSAYYGENKLMAVFSAWDKAQEYADRLNDSERDGYFVSKVTIKSERED